MSSEIRDEMEAAYTASEASSTSTPEPTPAPTGDPAPSADDAAASAPDVTTTQPSDTGVVPERAPGPLPYERHKAILEETRGKYAWVDKYGDQTAVQQRLAVTEWAERDPIGFLRTYAANQGIDPRTLFPQEQQAPAPPKVERPGPDVPLENGQWVYSDERLQQLLAFEREQMQQQFSQELAPIKQERAVTQLQQQAHQHARQQLAMADKWPGFKEHEGDLKQFLKDNPRASLHDAYINVVPAKLAEKAAAAETAAYQRALSDLQTKAGAASIPAPRTAGGPVVDTSQMSIREALEHALRG